jgi:hypothetical protein
MELTLKRIALRDTYTIGKLYINGEYECDTLEDTVRDLNKNGVFDNGEQKVYGKTAIPYGTYEVTMNVQSPKFSKKSAYSWCNGYLPRLLNVPSFDGILIHGGNTPEDTYGCILVGQNKVVGKVINSMDSLKKLCTTLKVASLNKEKITIKIE